MDAEQVALLDKIERAFGDVRHPGWDVAYHGHPAWTGVFAIRDWEIEEAEQNINLQASWKDIDPVTLCNATFLLNTTPSAFKFFLPAFMWQAIRNPDELDAGVCDLLFWLAKQPESQMTDRLTELQMNALSAEQKDVVRAFLVYVMGSDLAICGDTEALARVWGVELDRESDDEHSEGRD